MRAHRLGRHRARGTRLTVGLALAGLTGVLAVVTGPGALAGGAAESATRAAAPALTHPVSYGGLTIDVPSSWAVLTRAADACGTAGPAALYGPPPPPPSPNRVCPLFRRLAVVVTLGGGDRIAPVGAERRRVIHGIATAVSTQPAGGGGTVLVARFPGHHVWLSAMAPGPNAPPSAGGGIGVVRRVLATVHRT